jgi:hypothetical protein
MLLPLAQQEAHFTEAARGGDIDRGIRLALSRYGIDVGRETSERGFEEAWKRLMALFKHQEKMKKADLPGDMDLAGGGLGAFAQMLAAMGGGA